MLKRINLLVGLVCLSMAAAVSAAPKSVTLTYHVTKNGQEFANVSEHFQVQNEHYTLESITEGIGIYGLFGKRRLSSSGEVTPDGLRPLHFELQQGNNAKKAVIAEFDWPTMHLTMTSKGQSNVVDLGLGAQDLASYAYQFMYQPPQGELMEVSLTTGKKYRTYQYHVTEKEVQVDTPAGKFKAVHWVNDAKEPGDEKALWLGVESHHLPVKIQMQDDSGAKIEQTLTSINVE